jgi:hypothetical protein
MYIFAFFIENLPKFAEFGKEKDSGRREVSYAHST